jgi:LEA14-like dessication related protein
LTNRGAGGTSGRVATFAFSRGRRREASMRAPRSRRAARAPAGAGAQVLLVALLAACAALAPRPLPPGVTLDGVRVARLTPQSTWLTVILVVSNPNPYDVAVSALDANLAVEGVPLLTGALSGPVKLVAGADTRVEVDARASPGAAAMALERFARQASVRYAVTGSVVVQDGLRLPFARSGEVRGADLFGQQR